MKQTKKIAFVMAQWHADIVDQALVGFRDNLDPKVGEVDVFSVPGAFEMPLFAKKLAKSQEYAAIVCAAFVVNGGIYRHEFVAQAVVDGLMQVQLETEVPILSVSLTPHEYQGTKEQQTFFKNHFIGKGKEAALAVANIS